MSEDESFAFLLGTWIDTPSSNVAGASYDAEQELLEVGYHGGDPSAGVDYYHYFGCTFGEAQLFALADSKGVFMHNYFIRPNRPYVAVLKTRTPKGKTP